MTAAEILADLVSFPVLGLQSNDSIREYIEQYLEAQGIEYNLVYGEEDDRACVHCRIGPAVDGGVVLSGHTDVVPVEGQDWTSDPFTLVERDGKLYGRGSCDMKGFLACMLAAVPAFKAAKLKKPVYLAFTYDEEVGCRSGLLLAEAIQEFYDETPKYAIVGEPSRMVPVVGHKGIVVYKVEVFGSAGHSSRIRSEVSAVHEAARLVLWLEAYMDKLLADGHTDDRFDPPHTSIHVGQIQGGTAHNVIADKAWFVTDIRVIPSDSPDDIIADFQVHIEERLKELRQRFADTQINVSLYHNEVPPFGTPLGTSVIDFAKEMSGIDKTKTEAYAAEAGQYSLAGYETVICGPGDIAQAHRADEFIEVEQLELGYKMLSERLVNMLSE